MPIGIPDSDTAQAAAALAREAAPISLLNHSYRTYLFGMVAVHGKVDHEAAFVAAMIHDLGLTESHRGADDFAEVGAALAASFLSGRGWEVARIRLVEQAILRHTRLQIERDPSVRLVQVGTQIDVAGLGVDRIDPMVLKGILAVYPRLDFPEPGINPIDLVA